MKRKLAALKRLEEAHGHAAKHGGTCMTPAPIGERESFEFSCPNGHRNFYKRHDAVKQGKYCPACAMQKKGKEQVKYSKANLDAYAADKGAACLSDSYNGWNVNHLWRCDQGHEWNAKPRVIIAMGSWCPECAGNKKYSIEALNVHAAERGGKCLDLHYDSAKERSTALWECHFGHEWYARTDTVIGRGDWCPHCNTSYGERMARQIIEQLFDAKFPKTRPKWLIGEHGMPLEIDILNVDLFCAEYQGMHHYQQTGYTHDSFIKIVARDKFKVDRCREMGIPLVLIREFDNVLDVDSCVAAVKDALLEAGVKVPDRDVLIDYRSIYINSAGVEFFTRLNEYVAERDGSVVSDQFAGISKDYEVVCKDGHRFTLNSREMAYGKWCRECAQHERYLKYKRMVEKKGGKMISTRYVSSFTPLEIESASGVRFALTPHKLSHGVWRKG